MGLGVAALLLATVVAIPVYAEGPGSTTLISRPSGTAPLAPGVVNNSSTGGAIGGGGNHAQQAISDNGNRVVFASDADGLSTQDNNRFRNIFVRDNLGTSDPSDDTTILVSRKTNGDPADDTSGDPVISGDGTKVAFQTIASLDPSDTNGGLQGDIYVRDLGLNTTTLVSRGTGTPPAGPQRSEHPTISDDGNEIAFDTFNSLDAGADTMAGSKDVYLRDVGAQTTTLISRADGDAGTIGNGSSGSPSISGDGTKVAFETNASNLGAGDANTTSDVHLRDTAPTPDATRLVSRANDSGGVSGAVGDAASSGASISGDGTKVAFHSNATNLIGAGADTNNFSDIFVRDISLPETTQTTVRVSVTDGEAQANGRSFTPSLSTNGDEVAFHSAATNLNAADTNSNNDIHVRDQSAGTTELASRENGTGPVGTDGSFSASISGSGTAVTWESPANNLSAADDNDFQQIFKRTLSTDASPNETTHISKPSGSAPFTGDGVNSSSFGEGRRAVSADGRYIAFLSNADHLSAEDDNSVQNAFVRDLVTDTTALVGRASGAGGASANAFTSSVAISADGRKVAFSSAATNLPGGDGTFHVFLRDLDTQVTELVSRADGAGGVAGDSSSFNPTLSADGDRVAFETFAENLDGPGGPDTGSDGDVYVRDRSSADTIYASRRSGAAGAEGDMRSQAAVLSDDGSRVAFESAATNLDPTVTDSNNNQDIYARDLGGAEATQLVSRATGTGNPPAQSSGSPAISANGDEIAFDTPAPLDGVVDQNGLVQDVYLRETSSATTTLISREDGDSGAMGDNPSADPSISADGTRIAFEGNDPDFGGGNNGFSDIYVRDIGANPDDTLYVSRADGASGADAVAVSQNPSISASGNCVAFESDAENLTADYPGFDFTHIYMRTISGECALPPPPTMPPSATPPPGGSTAAPRKKCKKGRKLVKRKGKLRCVKKKKRRA